MEMQKQRGTYETHTTLYRFLMTHVTTEDLKNITKIELKNLQPIKLMDTCIGYELSISIFFRRGLPIFFLPSTIRFNLEYQCTRLLATRSATLVPTQSLLSITPAVTAKTVLPVKGPKFSVSTAHRIAAPRKLSDYLANIRALSVGHRRKLHAAAEHARSPQNKIAAVKVLEEIEDEYLALPPGHPDRIALCQTLPATNDTIKEIFYYIFEAVYNSNTSIFL